MTVKRTGLGRNLSALLGGVTPSSQHPSALPIDKLPIHMVQAGQYQPRRLFDDDALQSLAKSIQQQGLLQPIVVRALGEERYEILAGERRWRACQLAGLTEIAVIIKVVNDEEARVIALVENLQREDLTVLEAARAIEQLMKAHDLTHQQVADLLSQSRSHVSNQLRLLGLIPAVQAYLEEGQLDMGHARALLMLDEALQAEAAAHIIEKKLTVRATEQLVDQLKQGLPLAKRPLKRVSPMLNMEQLLVSRLNTKVEIRPGRAGKGKLVIHYDNSTRLEAIIARLNEGVV